MESSCRVALPDATPFQIAYSLLGPETAKTGEGLLPEASTSRGIASSSVVFAISFGLMSTTTRSEEPEPGGLGWKIAVWPEATATGASTARYSFSILS